MHHVKGLVVCRVTAVKDLHGSLLLGLHLAGGQLERVLSQVQWRRLQPHCAVSPFGSMLIYTDRDLVCSVDPTLDQ